MLRNASFLVALTLSLPSAVLAQRIDAVGGTVADRMSITVTGSGFGATGPTVVLFDDFESGAADGEGITPSSPRVGTWTDVRAPGTPPNPPRYSSAFVHGGRFVARFDADADPTHTDPTASYYNLLGVTFPGTLDVFFSFWHYLPVGDVVPGTGHVDDTNWKFVWLMEDDGGTVNDILIGHVDDPPTYPTIGGNNSGFGMGCNDGTHYPCGYCSAMDYGRWVRLSAYVHGGFSNDGELQVSEIPFLTSGTGCEASCGDARNTCQMLRKSYSGVNVGLPGHDYRRLNINGYNRETPNSHPTYDDVYLATGAGARARVELSSTLTWGDPAHGADLEMTICTVTSWNDTRVECDVRVGSFVPGAAVFAFVIDAAGNVSDQDAAMAGAQGFAVTIGGTMPRVDAGVLVVDAGGLVVADAGSVRMDAGGSGSPDAGSVTPPATADGGCGCRAARAGSSASGASLAALVAAVLVLRTRRRRRLA